MEYKAGDRVKIINAREAHEKCARLVCNGDIAEVIRAYPDRKKNDLRCVQGNWTCYYGIPYDAIELIKEETMWTQVKLVYKVMRIEDGGMKSVWAGEPDNGYVVTDAKGIVYKEGRIAYAPEGQQGLSTFDELLEAIAFAESQVMNYKKVIHEAVPLGSRGGRLGCSSSWGQTAATYPALLIGKEVWREEEPAPVEEWADVTRECELTLSYNIPSWVSVRHGGFERLILGSKEALPWAVQGGYSPTLDSENYKVELSSGFYSCGQFKVLKLVNHQQVICGDTSNSLDKGIQIV